MIKQQIVGLHAISPMPSDEELEQWSSKGSHPLDTYIALTDAIARNIPPTYPLEVISPLLSAFGTGDGFGAYWSVLHCLESFPQEQEVYAQIQQATSSPNPGTRKWCCLLLGRRRNMDDVPFLLRCLQDEVPLVRSQALEGIEMLVQQHHLPQALEALSILFQDDDDSIRESAKEVYTAILASQEEK